MKNTNTIIDKLYDTSEVTRDELLYVLNNLNATTTAYLHDRAHEKRLSVYGNKVFMRGLIEFTNFCKSNWMYVAARDMNWVIVPLFCKAVKIHFILTKMS